MLLPNTTLLTGQRVLSRFRSALPPHGNHSSSLPAPPPAYRAPNDTSPSHAVFQPHGSDWSTNARSFPIHHSPLLPLVIPPFFIASLDETSSSASSSKHYASNRLAVGSSFPIHLPSPSVILSPCSFARLLRPPAGIPPQPFRDATLLIGRQVLRRFRSAIPTLPLVIYFLPQSFIYLPRSLWGHCITVSFYSLFGHRASDWPMSARFFPTRSSVHTPFGSLPPPPLSRSFIVFLTRCRHTLPSHMVFRHHNFDWSTGSRSFPTPIPPRQSTPSRTHTRPCRVLRHVITFSFVFDNTLSIGRRSLVSDRPSLLPSPVVVFPPFFLIAYPGETVFHRTISHGLRTLRFRLVDKCSSPHDLLPSFIHLPTYRVSQLAFLFHSM